MILMTVIVGILMVAFVFDGALASPGRVISLEQFTKDYKGGKVVLSQPKEFPIEVTLDASSSEGVITAYEYRNLPREHQESYWSFMHRNLFDHVNIPADKINLPNGNNQDAEAECAAYDAVIASLGGVDLQLLGIGHDGHIGFNEPADAFDLGTHCVDLTDETIEANKRFFNSKDEVPRQAYTMGTGTIMNARKVLMIVSGKDKAEIIKKAFFGPVTPQVPASILQMHPNFVLVADEDALSLV
jgi:glucosamine-6-phosphate deaminase